MNQSTNIIFPKKESKELIKAKDQKSALIRRCYMARVGELSETAYKYSKREFAHENNLVTKILVSRLKRLKALDTIEAVNKMDISR